MNDFECKDCGKKYSSSSGMYYHKKSRHGHVSSGISKIKPDAIVIGEVPKQPVTISLSQNGKVSNIVVYRLTLPEVVDLIAGVTRQAVGKRS